MFGYSYCKCYVLKKKRNFMIGFVNGILRYKGDGVVVVECGGIGYEVYLTNSAFYNLPDIDEPVKLFTWMLVKEDEMSLFGFESLEEKSLFLQLISVSGVGAKTALQILSGVKQKDLVNAIVGEDTNFISKIKGIGKKTAERIVLELKDKLNPYEYVLPLFEAQTQTDPSAINDAVVVLTSLGISKQQASLLARKVSQAGDTAEDIVAKALKNKDLY